MSYRTHWAYEVQQSLIDHTITVAGWVQRRRDHGGLLFVDVRDRTGLVQVVADPKNPMFRVLDSVRPEFVVSITGTVQPRPQGMVNLEIASGAVELVPSLVSVLAESKTPPFMPQEAETVDELVRLKYRYLDLRRPSLFHNFELRDRVLYSLRSFFHDHGFLDVETPALARSTPEGARDFLVPSRVQPGQFYALPQSPQIFKQLLMVAGFERYYQIAKVFRDEDLRADRQPEFTQIDVEMSFVDREEILSLMEALMKQIFRDALNVHLEDFPRMTYADAMRQYGSDKPDLRAGEPLVDLTELAHQSEWSVLAEAPHTVGVLCRQYAPSRKALDDWTQFAKQLGMGGLVWLTKSETGIRCSAAKWLDQSFLQHIERATGLHVGDTLFLVSGEAPHAFTMAGQLRLEFSRRENRIEPGWRFLWVTEFPLFEWSEEEGRLTSAHHPFTMPMMEDHSLVEEAPTRVRSEAYDVVLNGIELASGSLRIYRPDLQAKIFSVLGLSDAEIQEKFGFLLQAFQYGAPPHGGIAFGLDRIVMLMAGAKSLREVIAFPKTARGTDPLMDAPSTVDSSQLLELGIQVQPRQSGH